MHSRSTGRLTLSIVANEVFAKDVGRMGGFGWAVRQVARCFGDSPELGVDVSLMIAERPLLAGALPETIHGARVFWPTGSLWSQFRRARASTPDLFLSIDYRSGYRRWFYAMPRVPILVWVRDPWSPADRAKVATLAIPGASEVEPQGVRGPNPGSLTQVCAISKLFARPTLFAVTASQLAEKVFGAYGVAPPEVGILPNIVDPAAGILTKSARPLVVFLARLDPIKRPWLFATLAERFPEVDFVAMGQSHFRGPGTWAPDSLPANLRLLGHTDEDEKQRLLSAAWILVNTSIHEGLSVGFLEALAREVPIIAAVDPDTVVSRFGIFVGSSPGTGEDLLPSFEAALGRLLDDAQLRSSLGAAGRAFVESTHSRDTFLRAFARLVRQARVRLPAGLEPWSKIE